MNKKIINVIIGTLIALIPFKVNAATTCTEHTNYYFLHDALSKSDFSGESCFGNDDCSLTKNSTWTATYKNTIPRDADIISAGLINGGIVDSNSEITISRYHNILFNYMFEGWGDAGATSAIKYEYKDDDVTYLEHRKADEYGTVNEDFSPMFFQSDYFNYSIVPNVNFSNYSDVLSSISNTVDGSYLPYRYNTNENAAMRNYNFKINNISATWINRSNYSNSNNIEISVSRNYTAQYGLLDYCIYDPQLYGANYSNNTCIIPSVYKIVYEVCDDDSSSSGSGSGSTTTTKYTITYHSNDGTNATETVTKVKNSLYEIKENMFTRDGYKFIGWSRNEGATQIDSNYDPGKEYKVTSNLDLYAVWVKVEGATGTTDQSKTGLGYSIGILGTILAATGGGVVYLRRRNKFENI